MWEHYYNLLNNGSNHKEVLQDCTLEHDLLKMEDIAWGIGVLKNNKALGQCNISAEVLKAMCNTSFCKFLTLLFNSVLKIGLPKSWNVLSIVSLYKKGDPQVCGNYRGLSIMHVFSKLPAVCLNNLVEG